MIPAIQLDTLRLSPLTNRPFIEVPWNEADALCDKLRAAGILATACYDPSTRTAGLELPADADPQTLQAILSA
jgi:hypothetical protein